jgi:hypothetical protein
MTLFGYAWGLWPGCLYGVVFSQLGGAVAWFSVKVSGYLSPLTAALR